MTEPQRRAYESTARYVVFLAGIGAGKTSTMGAVLAKKIVVPKAVVALCAPDLKVLKNATLPAVVERLAEFGYVADRDYVVGRLPPKEWRVPPYTKVSQNRIMTFRTGAYVILDGLLKYDSIRGVNLDGVLIDEFRDVKEEAWNVVLGRLRGRRLPAAGRPLQIHLFTSPPDDPTVIKKIIASPNCETIAAPTWSNPFLPPEYVDELRATLSPLMFRREVCGELVTVTDKPFAMDFDAARHVAPVAPFSDDEVVYLSFDFNVNPATCTAWRIDARPGGRAECVREFAVADCSLPALCAYIRACYPGNVLFVTGDASGRARQGANASLHSMYDIVKTSLGLGRNQVSVPRSNQSHKESWALCNALFANFAVAIDPSCTGLIRDLETVAYDAVNGIDKSDKTRGHLLDTLRYAFRTWLGWFLKIRLD